MSYANQINDGTYPPQPAALPPVRSEALLNAARKLFDTGHKASPFMTLENGPNGCSILMKFKTFNDGANMHTALVEFFTANARPVRTDGPPRDSGTHEAVVGDSASEGT